MSYAELEIGLHRLQGDRYEVELRFSNPESAGEIAPEKGTAELDLQKLLGLQAKPGAYGEALTQQLFADRNILSLFERAKTAAATGGLGIRVRLLIGPTAAELNALRWELLTDPESHRPLATSENMLFSRFMTSRDWRPVILRPRADLKALVAVSAPPDISRYQLAEVDLEGETSRAQESLKGIHVSTLGGTPPLTPERLLAGLREGVDILYLVCHGSLSRKGNPVLFLQNEKGEAAPFEGEEIAIRISELQSPPRLLVLASCESAGTEAASTSDRPDALTSLAPRLAEAGIPAIVAMQGKISMETVKQAMPVFFTELLKDGQIDRAMAVARGNVRDRPDSWMPALFLRLRKGRVWYEPGFGEGEADFAKWKAIISTIRSGRFTPILGSGLGERVYGRSRDIAEHLARTHHFPLAPHQRDDLAQVTQYLRVNQSYAFARDSFKEQLRRELLARHRELSEELQKSPLPKLLRTVGEQQRQEVSEPYRILADLPAAVFINANPDNLLAEALKAAGKEPESIYCKWRNEPRTLIPYNQDPTPQAPLVYHILGYFKEESSLVLTEDDYFDYLIGTSLNKPLIPEVVRHATTSTSLLFLGFQLTDWSFRVLFRIIMSQEGGARRDDYAHVAVQVDPEEHTLIDAEKARQYLKDYFEKGASINIFWGSAEDFLGELKKQLEGAGEDSREVEEEEEEW